MPRPKLPETVSNQRDKRRKGRSLSGARNTHAVLTEHDVCAIRALRETQTWRYGTASLLSRLYGVSVTQIRRIANGEGWRSANA